MTRSLGLLAFSAACLWLAPASSAPTGPLRWYKGNLHTHTINSDGDSSPDEVARWYKEHKYQFLVLTDHNYVTSVDGLNSLLGASEKFLLVPGEEVTSGFEKKPIHINAFNPKALVEPQSGSSVLETLQRNIDAIGRAGAMPSINHPNFGWALTADDLRQAQNDKLFELYNGHPEVHNIGGGGSPGLEQVWDALLSSGRVMYGIAVDDAHYFKQLAPDLSNPGRAWVSVRAPELTTSALLGALDRGDFYASTGVELTDVARLPEGLRVEIKPFRARKYTTEFIGHNGRVLKTSYDNLAVYNLAPADRYVRARVTSSAGEYAWTQPIFRQ